MFGSVFLLVIRSLSGALALCLGVVTPTTSSAELETDWNQWRGPTRDAVVPGSAKAWPDSLDDRVLVKLWSASVGESYASPVVSGNLVFSVATHDRKQEVVRAFRLETGEPVWETRWDGAMKVPFFAAKNGSWVRSTPAIAEGAIYVAGMRDVLIKLDALSGEEQWRIDFTKRDGTELPTFGFVSSPLPGDGLLYVQAGGAVAAIDPESGHTRWRALEDRRAMFGSAFSSPVLATIHGQRQLVAQTRLTLAGLDPATGVVLWSTLVEAFRGMNILTPTVIGDDQVFTATYGGGCFLFTIEKNEEGKLTAKERWRLKDLEGYMSSPLQIGGYLYLLGRDQHLHCIEISTGKIAWKTTETYGEYWSMVRQGNKVLALDQKGELILFRASPDSFELIARRRISPQEPTWAHLGVTEDKLLVRSLKALTVYQWK